MTDHIPVIPQPDGSYFAPGRDGVLFGVPRNGTGSARLYRGESAEIIRMLLERKG